MIRVANWQRWQRAKAIVAGALFISGIGLIGGLEGFDTPDTWPLGVMASVGALTLFNNIIHHDQRLNPDRYK